MKSGDTVRRIPIISGDDVSRILIRIAHQIIEDDGGSRSVMFVGLRTRGEYIAHRLAKAINDFAGWLPETFSLDTRPFRDDVAPTLRKEFPAEQTTPPFEVTGRHIVIVDDVICTGRTARAALDALMAYGRPARVKLATIVDRGHRELPIRPDFVGKNIPTSSKESIKVLLSEVDGEDSLILVKPYPFAENSESIKNEAS